MSRETLVFAFHDQTLYKFERADKRTVSYFGGPLCADFTGEPFGPKPLHQIACLGQLHIGAIGRHFTELPLIFGIQYSACELSYRIDTRRKIEILHIQPPVSLDDWPYLNFPPLLPFVPLRLEDIPRSESYDGFAQRFPNMPCSQPTELVVAVPPPATVGLSLWEDGDWNKVTIVFECDLNKKQVKSYAMTS